MKVSRLLHILPTAVVAVGTALVATVLIGFPLLGLFGIPGQEPFVPPTAAELAALGLPDAFDVPAEPLDQHGNPVWRGRDSKTGLPRQIRHRATGMHLMFIPAGRFEMRSNAGHVDEKPVHTVTLTKPFYMGRYEVTQAEWQSVMGANPSQYWSFAG